MVTQIELGDIAVDVVQNDIKNIHLSVYPPTGKVRISTPLRMDIDTIHVFAITKLGRIKSQQKKLREQECKTPRKYFDRESHDLWGKRYLLKVEEKEAVPEVELKHNRMILGIRPAMSHETKQAILKPGIARISWKQAGLNCKMGAADRHGTVFCAKDENEMGQL